MVIQVSEWRRRIDGVVDGVVGSNGPGLVLAVLRAGEVIHQVSRGAADLSHGIALTPRCIIRIGSQTKQFTAYLALMLERDGLLALDHDVKRYLTWLPQAWPAIEVRQLANNTSGVRDLLELLVLAGVSVLGPVSRDLERQVVAWSTGLNAAPGTEFLYSNANFLLLADVLETASGRSYADLLDHYVTRPLGMDATRLCMRDDEIVSGASGNYRRGPGGQGFLRAVSLAAIGGEGGLVSSLEDMVTWQRHLRNPPRDLAHVVAAMEATTPLQGGQLSPYGLGLVHTRHGGLAGIGHGGSVIGARSESVRFPAHDLGVVLIANREDVPAFALARRVAAIALGLPDAAGLTPERQASFAALSGIWRERNGPRLFELRRTEGGTGEGVAVVSTMGAVPLSPGPQGAVPAMAMPPFELIAGGAGEIIARRFGTDRIYVRPDSQPMRDPRGCYRCSDMVLDLEIAGDEPCLAVSFRSPFGSWSADLIRTGGDLFRIAPRGTDLYDIWRTSPWNAPWMFSLHVRDDGVELASDLTRGLRFAVSQRR